MPAVDRGLDARALCFALLVGVVVLLASGGGEGANPPSLQITAPLEGAVIASTRVEVTWSVSDAGSGLTEIQQPARDGDELQYHRSPRRQPHDQRDRRRSSG